jgi:serine/threonine protein kinase
VYNEILLREERGETPRLEEYLQRFPQFAAQLKPLFEVHRALESGSLLDPSRDRTMTQKTLPETQAVGPTKLPVLPGYEVLRELGRGGMGVVYSAWQMGLNRVIAVKMVRAENYIDPLPASLG